MSNWISVSDGLPNEGKNVIVFPFNYDGSEDFSITGIYDDGDWCCERSNIITVTHWMPLPDSPSQ